VTAQEFIAYWRNAHERGEQMSWGDIASLTHETQVGVFGFCSCEDPESPYYTPYPDCPPPSEPRYV
jgi:hypothetical protein